MDPSEGESAEVKPSVSRRSRCRDVFLFSHPRTASNLVTRLLSHQPGWIQTEYHFRGAFHYARRTLDWNTTPPRLSSEHCQEFEALFQKGFVRLCQERDAAMMDDKSILVKNHTFHLWDPCELRQNGAAFPIGANPTRLPDDFLTSWQPVFLVRHPALVFESWYRAETRVGSINILDSAWDCFLTYRYSRRLYDWFASNDAERKRHEQLSADVDSCKTIIIDADDVIDMESTVSKLCELLKMDPSKVCYRWDPTKPPSDKELSLRHMSYMSGFWASDSIDKSKSSRGLDIGTKHAQWKYEFGDVVADALLAHVNNAMADYDYLRKRRI